MYAHVLRETTEVEKTMPDVFGSGEGEEGTGERENFIGRVRFSNVDCSCEHCTSGKEALAEMDDVDDTERDVDHLYNIEPLTVYEDTEEFNEFGINTSNAWSSKWMVLTAFIENNIGTYEELGIESVEDLTSWLEDKVFEFRDVTFDEDEELVWEHSPDQHSEQINELFEDSDFQPNNMLVPVRQVTDDEVLAELGVEDSGEVEEVDF